MPLHTLSLHIAAFENSIETESYQFGNKEIFEKEYESAILVQNPFEFPTQQQNNGVLKPEICQYKTSQQILSFNEAPKKSLNLYGIDKDEKEKNFVGKNAFEIPRGQEGNNNNNNNNEPEVMQFKPSQKLIDTRPKSAKSGGGRSDTDLQHLRARFHATQFRFTSALAAEHGKASDGVFRIQLKPSDNLKPTVQPPKDIYEPIEAFENEEGLKSVEAKEPEYDMFAGDSSSDESGGIMEEWDPAFIAEIQKKYSSSDESGGIMEEWDPAFIADIQKKCNIRWRESVMEEDPLTDKDELQAIRKRRAEELHKEKENKKKEELKALKPVEALSKEALGGGAPLTPSLSKESLDAPHVPAFSSGGAQSAEPLIPATNLFHPVESQEVLGITLSRESIAPNSTDSDSKLNATRETATTTKGAEPLFDCLENEIILDDSNLSDITNGLKEGMTYDNALVSEDLKKKLLEIHENKEKVEEELVRKALEREDTPVKTDATANKIVEALTDYEVIAKMVAVEDSKMLKEYFDGSRKADDEVIAALDRVIDRILDRAADVYPNKEELAKFLRNRGMAKSHLLDAMLSRKGGWLQNMYGSAYDTALAIYSGANKTVEVVGKGLAAAKDVAEQSTAIARDYAATTVDVVNRSYTKANELAEQSASVAREVATKGSEMYSKAADVASYSTEQARRVASVTALFAGKVSSVASSLTSSSSTSVSSSGSATNGTETESGTSATGSNSIISFL
uniref:Uncharacterized protein n=1 Tax=Panagrolaimus sp. PS1159 TaxID=55785 RepID=A0AC35FW88_9BILA